jgi:hypothetical protein
MTAALGEMGYATARVGAAPVIVDDLEFHCTLGGNYYHVRMIVVNRHAS